MSLRFLVTEITNSTSRKYFQSKYKIVNPFQSTKVSFCISSQANKESAPSPLASSAMRTIPNVVITFHSSSVQILGNRLSLV